MIFDTPQESAEESNWTLSAVNEELYQKCEKMSEFQRLCESKLSHDEIFDYKTKLRNLQKIYSLTVVNNRNIEWVKKSEKEVLSQNIRTNLYVILSFVILSCILIFSDAGATSSICFMAGLLLYWFIVISEKLSTEQKNITKMTAYDIQQKNLERDAEEFNVNSTLFPFRNILEISVRIDSEEDPIVKEELDLKGQILYMRMRIGLLTRYSVINEMLGSSEFREALKDTNNEMLKKFKN